MYIGIITVPYVNFEQLISEYMVKVHNSTLDPPTPTVNPLFATWNRNKAIDDAVIFMKFDVVILSKILIDEVISIST